MADITLPPPFVSQMEGILGNTYTAFEQALLQPSKRSIRLHPHKWKTALDLSPVPWYNKGYWFSEEATVTYDPLLHAGAYYVQEASSMFIAQLLEAYIQDKQSLHVLDLCAAPGGKSTLICDVLNDQHLLVSNEVIKTRVGILDENLLKWGYNNVIVTHNDPADFERLGSFFDVIVVDAPCSGEGMFRKDPAAIQEWDTAHVDMCCSRQKRILSDIWKVLRPGGIIIYSTCTFNRKENEENMRWMKEQYQAEGVQLNIPSFEGVETSEEHGIPSYRFYPHKVNGEGFFASVIRKPEESEALDSSGRREKWSKDRKAKEKLSIPEITKTILTKADTYVFLHKEEYRCFAEEYKSALEQISMCLKIYRAGTPLGVVKGKDFLPDVAVALSIHLNTEMFDAIELTYDEAIKYLSKEEFLLQEEAKGWNIMCYKGLPLGWIKAMPNRFNNYYPNEWRIRNQWNGVSKRFMIGG
jgi:16S rRNA C967 or C1407 C5-methylase (RsmB/RsmF family)/NOL1/NOP2/fmu family ribosome biogenesis protein